jgi:hypothetical protein
VDSFLALACWGGGGELKNAPADSAESRGRPAKVLRCCQAVTHIKRRAIDARESRTAFGIFDLECKNNFCNAIASIADLENC